MRFQNRKKNKKNEHLEPNNCSVWKNNNNIIILFTRRNRRHYEWTMNNEQTHSEISGVTIESIYAKTVELYDND